MRIFKLKYISIGIILATIISFAVVYAQQISSGGMAVSGTFWQTTQPVSGTFWQSTQPVSIATMPSTPVTGTFWQATQPISATTALKIGETGSCGTTIANQPMIAVPTTSTAVFTSTTCVTAIYINNTNATAQTITVTDNAGTPLNVVGPALSIPGLSSITIPFHGMAFTTGVKWIAGGSGVTGGIVGYQ
jgi:hypothetical protein